jgi:hypothetical protein
LFRSRAGVVYHGRDDSKSLSKRDRAAVAHGALASCAEI